MKRHGKMRTYVSLPEPQYLSPDKIGHCRNQAKKLGHLFRSGKRVVKYAGVQVTVTVAVVTELL